VSDTPVAPQRICVGCKQTDDHPRHVEVIDAAGTAVPWHMDCHALITGCETCTAQTAGADGATGDALRTHIIEKGN
jgi:hypothetical protein